MARPREFDEEQVLQRALEVFRAKGFEGATLDELEQATGLHRGSLYGAFGDKRRLFLKALARYLDTALGERLAVLETPQAGRTEILALFQGLARDAACDRERKGCLVTNCAIELADRDPDLACQAARSLDRFERAFAAAVRQAQARGEIAATHDPVRLARFLTVCMEGMLVLARARPDPAWLDDAVAAVAEVLR
ncbi:TetR/AcrR family transcriptional regulator [Benzoatithermus flavus]|uniref:TetR/AcrR family transcriptional regulator n=1 Tax=Benzoatithermus flavus TaxID=3108223 RepID=A0ABU8XPW5_9PROT